MLQVSEQAIALDSNHIDGWICKGIALHALGRNEEAIVAYDQTIRLNPKISQVYTNKGNALYALRMDEEAIAAITWQSILIHNLVRYILIKEMLFMLLGDMMKR